MIKRILALNSLVNVLTLTERMCLQKQRNISHEDFYCQKHTYTINVLITLILRCHWYPPERKYNIDYKEVWFKPGTKQWQSIETYNHPIIQETIHQIPIKK